MHSLRKKLFSEKDGGLEAAVPCIFMPQHAKAIEILMALG